MSKKNLRYCQCVLEKRNHVASVSKQVAFIPKQFAVVSRSIRIKSDCGTWENGWVVKSVGAEMAENQLPDSHAQIKGHRMNTGDVTPRPKNR